MHILRRILAENKAGHHAGVYSCCSANGDVIKAVLLRARLNDTIALVESTSNQVNQFGGYTDMTPSDFREFTLRLAHEVGLDHHRVILGGDHLGPLPWARLPEREAMVHAEELVRQCVLAGYTKIHLDTSMRLGDDDPATPLATSVCALRGARLCAVAEAAYESVARRDPGAVRPVYVIGSEVPVPGGDCTQAETVVTSIGDCRSTIESYRAAFAAQGLSEAFQRVVAVVVQLGAEFFERHIDEYDRRKTAGLVAEMRHDDIVFEGHSTDYQTPENLRRMCEDGVAILKVGPALTFSLREALFALEAIERDLYASQPGLWSNFRETLESVMLGEPSAWDAYYTGDDEDRRISRAYSFYDRCRYYLPHPAVRAARDRLIANLSGNVIPTCMLSQYLPSQYLRVRGGSLQNEPEAIVLDRIGDRIDGYLGATIRNGMPEGYEQFMSTLES